jgi:hypothetical protein
MPSTMAPCSSSSSSSSSSQGIPTAQQHTHRTPVRTLGNQKAVVALEFSWPASPHSFDRMLVFTAATRLEHLTR